MRESELPPQKSTMPAPQVGCIQLGPRHRFSDVIAAIDSLRTWPYAAGIDPPSRNAVIRAKELALGVGPLRPGGPARVLVAPSIKGGVVLTFYAGSGTNHDVTVATMNNHVAVLVLGRGWKGHPEVVEMSHTEALAEARKLGRSAHVSSTEASPSTYRRV